MSHWMTSGRNRLKAKEHHSFADRAQSRAAFMGKSKNRKRNSDREIQEYHPRFYKRTAIQDLGSSSACPIARRGIVAKGGPRLRAEGMGEAKTSSNKGNDGKMGPPAPVPQRRIRNSNPSQFNLATQKQQGSYRHDYRPELYSNQRGTYHKSRNQTLYLPASHQTQHDGKTNSQANERFLPPSQPGLHGSTSFLRRGLKGGRASSIIQPSSGLTTDFTEYDFDFQSNPYAEVYDEYDTEGHPFVLQGFGHDRESLSQGLFRNGKSLLSDFDDTWDLCTSEIDTNSLDMPASGLLHDNTFTQPEYYDGDAFNADAEDIKQSNFDTFILAEDRFGSNFESSLTVNQDLIVPQYQIQQIASNHGIDEWNETRGLATQPQLPMVSLPTDPNEKHYVSLPNTTQPTGILPRQKAPMAGLNQEYDESPFFAHEEPSQSSYQTTRLLQNLPLFAVVKRSPANLSSISCDGSFSTGDPNKPRPRCIDFDTAAGFSNHESSWNDEARSSAGENSNAETIKFYRTDQEVDYDKGTPLQKYPF